MTDATWLADGAVLVLCNERGVFVFDDSEATARQLALPADPDHRPD